MKRLRGRVAIITGAAQGMGEMHARMFYQEGADVVLCDIREDLLDKLKEEISPSGEGVLTCFCDARKENDIVNVVEAAVKKFGKIDILVNNAGKVPEPQPSWELASETWDDVYDLNIKGVWLFCKAVLPYMIKQEFGRIINISSIHGLLGLGTEAVYSSSKHAVIGLTKSIAMEVAHLNITVNAVCPGGVRTPMLEYFAEKNNIKEDEIESFYSNPQLIPRLIARESVSSACIFLASDEAKDITAIALPVEGGWLTKQAYKEH